MGELRSYPHAPSHLFVHDAVYMVTAGTYKKSKLFNTEQKLKILLDHLHDQSSKQSWELIAWAVLPNHYHFIARSPDDPMTLITLIRGIHSITAKILNKIDQTAGRRVWHNYWDTYIRSEDEFLQRLKYVLWNPVKHGMVTDPIKYPYSGYKGFTELGFPINVSKVDHQAIDKLGIHDPY